METNLNTMELEISLTQEEDEHDSEIKLAKECRTFYNETKKNFMEKEHSFFQGKQKMFGRNRTSSDFPENNDKISSCNISLLSSILIL